MVSNLRTALLGLCALLIAFVAHADVTQGRDYRLVQPPQPTSAPGKIEVIEFFSYGCPHCANFHPEVTRWAKALPEDTVFVRVPVAFGRRPWGQLVRAFYALEATGDLAKVDDAIFKAIHEEGKQLVDQDSIAAWLAQQGVDATKFRNAFNSFDVSRKSQRAEQMSREYGVSGVPHLVINGKYGVIGQDRLRIADELIERERAAKASSAASSTSP